MATTVEMPEGLLNEHEIEEGLVIETSFVRLRSFAQIVTGGGIEVHEDSPCANLFHLLLMLGVKSFAT